MKSTIVFFVPMETVLKKLQSTEWQIIRWEKTLLQSRRPQHNDTREMSYFLLLTPTRRARFSSDEYFLYKRGAFTEALYILNVLMLSH